MNQIIYIISSFFLLNLLNLGKTQLNKKKSDLKKCCSKTKILNVNLDCVPLISDETFETDIFALDGYGHVSYNARPPCPTNVTYVELLNNFNNDTFSCVDKLIADETDGKELWVGLVCPDTSSKDRVDDVQIFSVNKCCPRYYQYDRFKRCVYKNGFDFGSQLVTSLFKNNKFNISYINIKYGLSDTLNRNDIVTDYKTLRTKTLYLNSESLEILYESNINKGENFKKAKYITRIIPFDHACIDIMENDKDHYVVRKYEPYTKVCANKNCLRKCCAQGFSMVHSGDCHQSENIFNPRFNTLMMNNSLNKETSGDYAVRYGKPSCFKNVSFSINLLGEKSKNYLLLPNGTVRGDGHSWDTDNYCVEHVVTANSSSNYVLFFCEIFHIHDTEFKYFLNTVLLIISTVFAFLTLAVYAILPFLHKNIHGKCLMCYFVCVCLFCPSISAVRFYPSLQTTSKSLCLGIGMLANFGYLATCSWLNVLCFDIWNKFRNIRVKAMRDSQKKFFLYNMYGWGVPVILSLLLYITEHHDTLLRPEHRANMAVVNCWFKDPANNFSMKLFNIIPLTVFIVINIGLFSMTAYHCTSTKNQIQRMKSGSDGQKENLRTMFNSYKGRLLLNLKLLLGMGVFWVCEILQRYIDTNFVLTFILDFITTSQGIFIFLLFIAKRRIWKHLVAMYETKVLRQPANKKNTSRSTTMTAFTINSFSGGQEEGRNGCGTQKKVDTNVYT